VKIGYIPADSFAALYIMADRYLTPAGVNAQMVRLPGGAEITTQVATGQLQMGGSGMGEAGFDAVAAKLPVELIGPLHFGYVEDYFTVRKAAWGGAIKRIADLKGHPVGLNTRGAAVEWMLDQVLRRDGLTIKDVEVKIMPFPDMVPALESGAIDAAIITEPVPTLAEEKGVGVRPLARPAGAKAVPITATFWNAEWARANADLAHKVMIGYLKAVRDLAADGGKGWTEDRNIDLMVKYASSKKDLVKKARSHVADPNLELDASTLDSMQKLSADLGYLKYTEFLSADKLFTFKYRDQAVKELGRR
jgi:NitT/TauT family transport system substrate-binding protein